MDPKEILTHLDYALDLAEQHKGQSAILKKVSVVTKSKEDSGKFADLFYYFMLLNLKSLCNHYRKTNFTI